MPRDSTDTKTRLLDHAERMFAEDGGGLPAALGDFALASLSIDNEDVIMSDSVTDADVVTVKAKNICG